MVVNLWPELIFNGVSIFTQSANSPLLPALMAEAIYTNSAHQRVIGKVTITKDRQLTLLLVAQMVNGKKKMAIDPDSIFFSFFKFQITSEKHFFLNKNEANCGGQRVPHKNCVFNRV